MDALSQTLSALADPTRRAILARLSQGEATVNELAEPFDISLPAVSRHLKVLEAAGLISRGREAQWRPCQLEAAPLKQVDGWLGRYRSFWEGSFDRMDAYLSRSSRKPTRKESANDRHRAKPPERNRKSAISPRATTNCSTRPHIRSAARPRLASLGRAAIT